MALRLTPRVSYFLRTRWRDSPWFSPKYLFPVVLLLPIADELIGAVQFKILCNREAVVTLAPNWQDVKRAKRLPTNSYKRRGYLVRVDESHFRYQDMDTGKVFFSFKHFSNGGGVLLDRFGLGLGNSRTCGPDDQSEVQRKVNVSRILEQGEIK